MLTLAKILNEFVLLRISKKRGPLLWPKTFRKDDDESSTALDGGYLTSKSIAS